MDVASRVLVVEDHPVLREALERLLTRAGMELVASVADAGSALRALRGSSAQIAVVDLRLPDGSGIELVRRMRERDGRLRALIYTGAEEPELLAQALESGAHGIVLKRSPQAIVLRGVRALAAGAEFVDPAVHEAVAAAGPRTTVLSQREREVLIRLADGRTTGDIADELSLSEATVRTHVRNLMGKLGASTRAHALATALRRGELRL